MAKRPSLEDLKKKALMRRAVRRDYDALRPIFEVKRQMIELRKRAGLTQQEMADRLGTARSNISRLESIQSDVSPRFATIEDYARVLGYTVKVAFEAQPQSQRR